MAYVEAAEDTIMNRDCLLDTAIRIMDGKIVSDTSYEEEWQHKNINEIAEEIEEEGEKELENV